MSNSSEEGAVKLPGVRDRRYVLRYPFVAQAELVDLDAGARAEGTTSDISLGGCFVCSGKPLPLKARARMILTHQGETLEALIAVRIVKPRIGMGVEFIDLAEQHTATLSKWIERLRSKR
jgi:c-di-GMP-binding flagellar brake protein YcgR